MPDFVGDDLIVRILHHIADFHSLVPLGHLGQRNSVKEDLSGTVSVRRQYRLQMPQKSGLTGAGLAAEHKVFAPLYRKIHFFQRFMPFGCGVGKAQIFDLEMCH